MIKVLLGDDVGLLKEEAKEAIRKDLGTVDEFNYDSFDCYNDLVQDIVESAETISFGAAKKCILIDNAYFLASDMDNAPKTWESKQDYAALAEYVMHPNPDCDLYFIGRGKLKGEKTNPAVKALKKYADVTSQDALRPEELAQKGLRYVGERKANISHEAMLEAVSRCPGGWLMLKNSLDKLICYTPNIRLEDVKALLAPSVEDSVFSVVSYLFKGDTDNALRSYRDLRKSNVDAVYLIAIFASQLRFFYEVAYLKEQRKNDMDISKILSCSPTRVRYSRNDIGNLSSHNLLKMMADLGKIEDSIKYSLDDADTRLELYLVNFRRNYLRRR
jgi:DNA polymerase-3 subunit delta